MPYVDAWKKTTVILSIAVLAGCSLIQHKSSHEEGRTSSQAAAVTGDDYHHALSALKAGKDEDALNRFEALSKSYPDFAASYINVGLIEIKRDNLHTAETALLHAAQLAPQQPEIYNGLGIIYRRTGRFNEAETAYLKALQLAPDYANAHLNIGILYDLYLSNLNKALNHYQRYQAISGGNNTVINKWIIDVKHRMAKTMGAAK
jgi:Flp pilus assembly protein TadD